MAEYRDLSEILTLAKDLVHRTPSTFYNGIQSLLQEIINLPAADVAPVRHGRWVETTQPMGCAECSECGEDFILDDWSMEDMKNQMPYCPNCGAKMDGGKE